MKKMAGIILSGMFNLSMLAIVININVAVYASIKADGLLLMQEEVNAHKSI